MKKVINIAARTVTWTFDGDLEPVTLHMDKLHPDNQIYAGLHGIGARVGDNAARARKDVPGGIVTEGMRREDVQELTAYYESGAAEWELRGGKRAAPQDPTIAAIAAKRGITYAEAQAAVAALMLADPELQ